MTAADAVDQRVDVAVVGGGPSAMYFLRWLGQFLTERPPAARPSVMVVERGTRFGVGWVYDDETVLPIHTLAANELRSRIDKGHELARDFDAAVAALRQLDTDVTLRPRTELRDLARDGDAGFTLEIDGREPLRARNVVLCTGHWDGRSAYDTLPKVFRPWPARTLQACVRGGTSTILLGTSHTAVDAAVTIADAFGRFRTANGRTVFEPTTKWPPHLTLASRGGFLPRVSGYGITANVGEADAALKYRHSLTAERLEELYDRGHGWIRLSCVLDLLLGESPFRDRRGGLTRRAMAGRDAASALAAVQSRFTGINATRLFRSDLACAARSLREQRYIPLQSLLWDKTELFRIYFHALPGEDRRVFDAHETLLLALSRPLNFRNASMLAALVDAGIVDLLRLGSAFAISADSAAGSIVVRIRRENGTSMTRRFDTAIDCTGQVKDIRRATTPLLTKLRRSGLIQPTIIPFDSPTSGAADDDPDVVPLRGERYYHPGGIHLNPHTMEAIPAGATARDYRGSHGRLFVLGPAMLGQYPISDGLHALHKVARFAAREVVQDLQR